MAEYTAPLHDMRFVLEHVVGLSDFADFPEFGEVTPELVRQVLEQAGRFAAEVLAPLNRVGDVAGAVLADGAVRTPSGFKEAYREFVSAGWNGLTGQPSFGGQGLPQLVGMAVAEMWNSANMAFCLCPMLTSGVLEALRRQGSTEQQQRYLPKLTLGEWTGTMNLTEPQAGSDLSAVRTRAVAQPDGTYRLYGQKIFITYGEHDFSDNIVHLVLARTPDAPEGTRGISLFIVPKYLVNADGSLGARNDVRCVAIEHKMGIHASPTCVLAYGDHAGAIGYLVGKEHEGLRYMFIMMNHARLAVGVEGVAIAERAYQHALGYARQRVQGRDIGARSGDRVAIIQHPDVRRMLLRMKAQTEAMRALAYYAAAALDRAQHHPDAAQRARQQALVDLLIPIVKGWCTERAVEIASLGVQVHGGMGFIEETGAAQFYRDARITTIYEGTTGIQALDLVGRKVAADGGATMRAVVAEIERMLAQWSADAAGSELVSMRERLDEGARALARATDWLVETHGRAPHASAAGAVPYLELAGIVLGGYMMARAGLIARDQLARGLGDGSFLTAKLASVRFYADHVLVQAPSLADVVVHGANAVLAMDEDWF